MSDPFALDDVAGDAPALAALPDAAMDRVAARWSLGASPLAAGAELARRRHPDATSALPAMVGAAAFVSADDLAVLLGAADAGVDALAVVALASAVPVQTRELAAELLGGASPTVASLAALGELAEGPKRPPRAHAERALPLALGRAEPATREAAAKHRAWAQQVRDGVRGTLYRQEFQRAMARGAAHPVLGLLVGDDGGFMAGLLPPVADEARESLLPVLLAVARGGNEALRAKVFGFFQRRWREVAAGSLSALARTPLKAKDAALGVMATRALGAMGAMDELSAVAGAGVGGTRAVALAELAGPLERGAFDGGQARLIAALERSMGDADAAVRARAEALIDVAR